MSGRPTHTSAEASAELAAESGGPADGDKVLCQHCRRTASNGIRCLGMCVADSDY